MIPITKNKAELIITLADGKILDGENNIQDANIQNVGIKNISYKNTVKLNEHAKEAILKADYIILGPGNYYCSLIPNLIVKGFKEILSKSNAKIIFPLNLTNKLGHTTNWKVSTYVKDLETRIGKQIDAILLNNDSPSIEQINRYKLEEGDGVLIENDFKDSRVVRMPLLSHILPPKIVGDISPSTRGFIRHDSNKLADCIQKIIEK